MFPNSPSVGRSPHPSIQRHTGELLSTVPLAVPPELLHAHLTYQKNANLSRMLMSGNVLTMPSQPWSYGNRTPLVSPGSSPSQFQNRKRRSDEGIDQYDLKRQRFQSPPQPPSIFQQSVPFSDDLYYSFSGMPLRQSPQIPDVNGRVPSSGDSWLFEEVETTLPVANDKLSQQILDLFQACQQQISDLKKKDICRAELQREIQQIFPQSRLYLVGSSLNGFGTRSSDADLCLVIKDEPMNQQTEARHILSLLQKHFYTRLGYIERPQLIRAKVPIVKFRDKVSGVEFDLNVNNVVGIRNTFLLRTYARALPEPVLPSLQKNYPECFNPAMQLHLVHLAPRNIPLYASKNESSLGDLLVGFLKYFAIEFDWKNKMISVREGKAVHRTDGIEWRNKYICVEEPFDRTNAARAVHEKPKFDMIQEEFMKGWVRLRDNKDLNSVLPLQRIIGKQK
ncbi:poly(A) RNA polymerase GLD2 isoform X2 [Bufo gargarizans]|uniref:poly(A) RNA polymerase GLD2 isoform X2 n=1 Tax=Bufo gargarizans TaxID=30331 RepID=UPI001CF2D9BD|nr:poly(A) RNA polymerase GLD2 isoform X2 [Bufo gargarizans]